MLCFAGEQVARVANARLDKASREVLRHDDLKDLVELRRVKDHFICEYSETKTLASQVRFKTCILIIAAAYPVTSCKACLSSDAYE